MATLQSTQSRMQTRMRNVSVFDHFWSYLFLIVAGLFVLLPLLIVVMQSLSTNAEISQFPPKIFPVHPTLDAYHQVYAQPDIRLVQWLGNSVFAAAMHVIAVMVICTPAAYAFARLKFP